MKNRMLQVKTILAHLFVAMLRLANYRDRRGTPSEASYRLRHLLMRRLVVLVP